MQRRTHRSATYVVLVWVILAVMLFVPLLVAALNPLQASRNAAYIVASLAGVFALGLMLVQPLLAAGYLPGLALVKMRRWHRIVGGGLVVAVMLHIGGLYLTSPPDTLDALFLVSPTPFSIYGVTAMWALVFTALLVALKKRLGIKLSLWRIAHNVLAVIAVISTIVHALMIEGTMGQISKIILCVAVGAVTLAAVIHLRIIEPLARRN